MINEKLLPKSNADEDFLIAAELAALNGYPYIPSMLPKMYKHLEKQVAQLNEIHKKSKFNL